MRIKSELFQYGAAALLVFVVGSCGADEATQQPKKIAPGTTHTKSTDSQSAHPQPPESKILWTPLDQVWARRMQDTRDIYELEKEPAVGKNSVDEILESLIKISHDLRAKQKLAKPGFAVEGSDGLALKNVHEILVGGQEPPHSLPAKSNVTLVVFSYFADIDFQVRTVGRHDYTIDIKYRFVEYLERNLTMQLALIPIGKLSSGKYRVNMIQLPAILRAGKHYIPMTPSRLEPSPYLFISQPFSFEVKNMEN